MTLHKVFDAANPPATAPAGCAGVLGYIGGPKATHTWTPAEWDRFPHLVKFPCWVPDLSNHAGTEATEIVNALTRAGWIQKRAAGEQFVVIIDYETVGQADAAWHSHLGQALGAKAFAPVAYGSLSTVVELEAAHVWEASWDNAADLGPGGQTVHGHQYSANAGSSEIPLDFSVVDDWLMVRGRLG